MSASEKKVLVRVARSDVSYPVLISKKASAAELKRVFESLGALKKGRRACVLIDAGVASARPDLVSAFERLYPSSKNPWVQVAGNESSKSFRRAEQILGQMIEAGLTRADLCVAIGGGVTGDLGGFVASLYMRGIDVVHVPTTLLAMVDSSIGGKTAVNHDAGKNLVGSFHQPLGVVAVLDLLRTLPEADFSSGLGEVFKYAVGFSPALAKYLKLNAARIARRDPATLAHLVLESARIKAKVVGRDERESGGLKGSRPPAGLDRRLLNLGHTTGHGLEKAYGLAHGVAVAAGVTLAVKLSVRLKLCPPRCYTETMELARELGLKTEADLSWRLSEILPFMKKDKKLLEGKLQFVCVRAIGRSMVHPVAFEQLKLLEGGI